MLLNICGKVCGLDTFTKESPERGGNARVNEFPWLALIRIKSSHDKNCTGSVINDRMILTRYFMKT